MRKNIDVLFESFDFLFDRRYYTFLFRKLLYGFVVLAVIIFIASRIASPVLRNILIALGVIGVYIALAAAFSAISRAVYQARFWDNNKSPAEHYKFSRSLISSFLLLPVMILVLGIVLKIVEAGVYFIGTVPVIGELIVSIFIVPIVAAGAALLLAFGISLFLGPALIAIEEIRGRNLIDRAISLVKKVPVQFFISFLLALIVASLIVSTLLSLVYTVLPTTLVMGEFIMETRFAILLVSVFGFLLPTPNVALMAEITPSFHIAAFIIWVLTGALLAAVFTPAVIYISSASLLLYKNLSGKEKEAEADKKTEDVVTAAAPPLQIPEPDKDELEAGNQTGENK
jgi:hypothetical protein